MKTLIKILAARLCESSPIGRVRPFAPANPSSGGLADVLWRTILFSTFSVNAFAATYVVDNMTDGDNLAAYTLSDGTNTLRKCIRLANASAGADNISFAAAATGTITLGSDLPAISGGTVTIDGGGTANTASTGALNGTLTRTIDGNNLYQGITISSDNNIIRGLNFINVGTVAGLSDAMINITSGADNNQVLGCYIGTTLAGTGSAGANTNFGVYIRDGANNQIGDGTAAGRNLISGLQSSGFSNGIYILDALATGNTIKGNIIGLQKDGATYLATTQPTGVFVGNPAASNTIGGTGAGEGNVISGNTSTGIALFSTAAAGNTVLGNIIGPQANGTSYVTSNAQGYGVFISGSPNNIIGGSAAGARNIISANETSGVYITGAGSTGNVVKGNYIGLDSTGTTFITNSTQDIGVHFWLSSSGSNTIGGTGAGEGNVISGNFSVGIGFNTTAAAGNSALGNIIGPQANGTSNVASNDQDYGIYINGSPNNIIGGSAALAKNIISANTNTGVYITGATSTGNVVKGNYIGLDINGTTYISGSAQPYGVYMTSSAASNTIGGTGVGEGNVISGNMNGVTGYGIYALSTAAAGNTVLGNIIGPQADGITYVASNTQDYGIYISGSPNNTIGGSAAGARNILSANDSYGVYITGAGSTGNVVKGNYIGLDITGTILIAGSSQGAGVGILTSAVSNTIGGTGVGEGNVISGNMNGVGIGYGIYALSAAAAGNSALGNIIGPQANGTSNVAANSQDYGIYISGSPNNTIGGSAAGSRNIISANETYGVYITGAGSAGNVVKGNYIGLDITGTILIAGSSQDNGVYLTASAASNIIGGTGAGEGNVISGNFSMGIGFNSTAAAGNSALGNIIGPQANGTSNVAANAQIDGVVISASPNNTIGGSAAGARNIVSSNLDYGIYITGAGSTGNLMKGNYIGLDQNGTTFIASSSQDYGVFFSTAAANNTIGGTGAGEGNVISGNTATGIYFAATGVASNSVLGNIIGPQANGTSNVALNAQTFGVIVSSSPNNTIGGSSAGARNIISANLDRGIYITGAISTGNLVKGNYIGAGSALASIASSNQDYGVYIVSSAANNTIGGSGAGEANTIAFNTVNGVYLTGASTDFNLISRNPIYSNGTPIGTGKPINLNYAGGSNNNKTIPVITTANTTTVVGTSGAGDIVEVFKNSTGNCNDAVTFVGAATANGAGNWSLAVALAASDYVFATATDASNNTSEFNPCVVSLPVEMLYFTAVLTLDKKVLCQWATASEINNDYFIVQRTRDGINYDFIAKVNSSAPNGNSSTTLYYSALDPDPYQGTSYYRLKQVDFNGDSYYSQLVPINLKSIDIINIYPNPSFGNINYLIGSVDADEITITVLDALGRKIMEEHEMIDVGITKKQIDISSHAAGSYLLQITTKTMEKTQKQFVIK